MASLNQVVSDRINSALGVLRTRPWEGKHTTEEYISAIEEMEFVLRIRENDAQRRAVVAVIYLLKSTEPPEAIMTARQRFLDLEAGKVMSEKEAQMGVVETTL